MAAAVWSSPPENIEKFPAHTLMRFWHNHGFLGLDTQHPWRTVEGGSREYVKKISQPFEAQIQRSANIKEVTPENTIIHEDGRIEQFDLIIFASHADQSLALLSAPTETEQDLLEKFTYQENLAVLHTDDSTMPKTQRCRASWNYRISKEGKHSTIYWMNSLQGVSDEVDYFVSINPEATIEESKIVKSIHYHHPVFDLPAIRAQGRISELHEASKATGRFFCGAWQRNGFHEDGLWSAHELCRILLERDPWP